MLGLAAPLQTLEDKEILLRSIIYAPQQANMERIFYPPGEPGDDQSLWHAIQLRFRDYGYELHTTSMYSGELSDVS